MKFLDKLEKELGLETFRAIFKTITVDNGSEFADCAGIERSCTVRGETRTKLYYCHPYSSWERGSNENQNRMIRRKVSKGSNFDSLPDREIRKCQDWLNEYPRKMFDGKCSKELFKEQLALHKVYLKHSTLAYQNS